MGTLAMTDLRVEGGGDVASVHGYWQLRSGGGANEGFFTTRLRRFPEGWKAVSVVVDPRPAAEMASRPMPRREKRKEPQAVPAPHIFGSLSSRAMQMLSGIAVIVIPRSIGEWLGAFHIGGGRGMMWFADIDTLVFDLALLCATIAFGRVSVSLRNPLAWLVVAMTLIISLPLAYTVTNFGTLFRLREMIFSGLLLTPLAVVTASSGMRTKTQRAPPAPR
jgi:hypothetical protein